MQIDLVTDSGEPGATKVEVADAPFAAQYNEPLVHQVVTAYVAGARAGTKKQKSRAEVRGGGAKPWRQKGTGRARAGSIRSPLWRGGGATFAARPRSYEQKVNRKMYRGAMRAIVSELLRRERLLVVESFAVERPKTRDLVERLGKLGLSDVLIVVAQPDHHLELCARNLHDVAVLTPEELNPVNLLTFDKVLVTVDALKRLEERLS